jgi:hypothetical protein
VNRAQITVVTVSALVFAIYVATGGTVAEQTAALVDAGIISPTHVANCHVRLSAECVAAAQDAGYNAHTHERLRFPVSMVALPDGGRDVTLPPMNLGLVRRCVEVVDWADCSLVTAASAPAVAALWGQSLPFTPAGATRKCVRPKFDAGLACNRLLSDGGVYGFGDRNVYPRAEAFDPLTCEPVECFIYLGEDPEVDL